MARGFSAVTLALVIITAGCGGKAERDRPEPWSSTDGDAAEDADPACREPGDCLAGERCGNGVCLPDPPQSGPLEDGALTTPARCENDSECFGGAFCDLGACAEPMATLSGEGFGQKCLDDDECDGYLCQADRCRSCVSSAECASDVQCYVAPGRGQQCVTLEEATALDWEPAPSR